MSDVLSALAETPEEIALSIMAEVFQVVRGGSGKGLS
jgi:xanthine/CO dehydrogenase XdhC/CoxF family maturation factor